MMMTTEGDDDGCDSQAQNQFSTQSPSSPSNYAMNLMWRNDLIPRFDSLLSLLTQSFFHLKNNIYQSDLTSGTLKGAKLMEITSSLFAKSDFA